MWGEINEWVVVLLPSPSSLLHDEGVIDASEEVRKGRAYEVSIEGVSDVKVARWKGKK